MRLLLLTCFVASTLLAAEPPRAVPVARAEAVVRAAPSAPEGDSSVATLRGGDIMEMKLSGMPVEFSQEFSQLYNVGSEGNVNIPYIGEVRAAGYTPSQLEKVIQQRLVADKIFTRPTVVITVQSAARSVTVGGGVKVPQRLPWSPDLTFKTAVDLCGGLDDFSSGKNIRLIRAGKVMGTYNYKKMTDPSQDPKLLPGDQVDVPKG